MNITPDVVYNMAGKYPLTRAEHLFYLPRAVAVQEASPQLRHLMTCSSVGGDYEQLCESAKNDALRTLHPLYGARFDGPRMMTP